VAVVYCLGGDALRALAAIDLYLGCARVDMPMHSLMDCRSVPGSGLPRL
jgi:hypothetical protein